MAAQNFAYENRRMGNSLSKKEQNAYSLQDVQRRIDRFQKLPMKRSHLLRSPTYIQNLSAIAMDDTCGTISSMYEMRDVGPALDVPEEVTEARTYFNQQKYIPDIWRQYIETGKDAPFLFKETSFINLFNEDMAVILDIFRPPWKAYFTSDVFLYQYLKANKRGNSLTDLPQHFPSILYINNISHLVSKHRYKTLLDYYKTDAYMGDFEENDQKFQLSSTPHIKCVSRILQAFNSLNELRGFKTYQMGAIKIYRSKYLYNLKLKISTR